MKSKKILPILLALNSCLPISNANVCISTSNQTLKDSKKNSTALDQNTKKSLTKSPSKKVEKNNQLLGNNALKYTITAILSLSLGVGITLYSQHVKNRDKLPDNLPTEAYSYLWPWVLLTHNYSYRSNTPPNNQRCLFITYNRLEDEILFDYYPDLRIVTESSKSLFVAVTKLYMEIINSSDFKSLIFNNNGSVFDRGKSEVLTKIKNQILGISYKIKIDENKYQWNKPEKNKVYYEMPSNSEIETNCIIKDDNGQSLPCSATFAKDNKGIVSLKAWKIGS